jgi:hypothetical protein
MSVVGVGRFLPDARRFITSVILGLVSAAVVALLLRYFPTNAHDTSDTPLRTLTTSWTVAGALGAVAALGLAIAVYFWLLQVGSTDGAEGEE